MGVVSMAAMLLLLLQAWRWQSLQSFICKVELFAPIFWWSDNVRFTSSGKHAPSLHSKMIRKWKWCGRWMKVIIGQSYCKSWLNLHLKSIHLWHPLKYLCQLLTGKLNEWELVNTNQVQVDAVSTKKEIAISVHMYDSWGNHKIH